MDKDPGARPHPLVRRQQSLPFEHHLSDPLDPRCELHRISLGDLAGLTRLGVHVVRLPPARQSCVYHNHACEEELIYVLSGRGIAEIDGEEHEVGPGDFMGFPTPSAAHRLANPFDEDLVYLVAGERREVEISELPRLGKRILRRRGCVEAVEDDGAEVLWKDEPEPPA
jgi:uncharacterized cupin superfamily protein